MPKDWKQVIEVLVQQDQHSVAGNHDQVTLVITYSQPRKFPISFEVVNDAFHPLSNKICNCYLQFQCMGYTTKISKFLMVTQPLILKMIES